MCSTHTVYMWNTHVLLASRRSISSLTNSQRTTVLRMGCQHEPMECSKRISYDSFDPRTIKPREYPQQDSSMWPQHTYSETSVFVDEPSSSSPEDVLSWNETDEWAFVLCEEEEKAKHLRKRPRRQFSWGSLPQGRHGPHGFYAYPVALVAW